MSWGSTAAAFNKSHWKRITSGNHSCPGCDLSGAPLEWENLRGANLAGANLTGAALQGADLRNANLRGANLRNANIQRAKLGNAIWIDGRRCIDMAVGSCPKKRGR